jgi:hypothetical protein
MTVRCRYMGSKGSSRVVAWRILGDGDMKATIWPLDADRRGSESAAFSIIRAHYEHLHAGYEARLDLPLPRGILQEKKPDLWQLLTHSTCGPGAPWLQGAQ